MSKSWSFRVGSLFGGYVCLSRVELSGGGYRVNFDAELTRWKDE